MAGAGFRTTSLAPETVSHHLNRSRSLKPQMKGGFSEYSQQPRDGPLAKRRLALTGGWKVRRFRSYFISLFFKRSHRQTENISGRETGSTQTPKTVTSLKSTQVSSDNENTPPHKTACRWHSRNASGSLWDSRTGEMSKSLGFINRKKRLGQ